jgi:hypothetical protein
MINGKLVLSSLFAVAAVSSFAQIADLGAITLTCTGYVSGDGDFQWTLPQSLGGGTVYTYCMSVNDEFSGSGAWTFEAYSISSTATVADIAAYNNGAGKPFDNSHSGLTDASLLEAIHYAETVGEPNAIGNIGTDPTTQWDTFNDNIHSIESTGNTNYDSYTGTNSFIYLEQAQSGLGDGGQPQGIVVPGAVPNVTPEPVTTFLCLGAAGLAFKRRLAARA